MAHEFTTTRIVEFAETDMAGILHFSNYFRYMEATEHAFFRSLGFSLHQSADGVMHGWARARAECRYLYPLRYEDLFEVHLLVREKSARSLGYAFAFRLPKLGRALARGALEVVFVARGPDDERMHAADMPSAVFQSIETAPPEMVDALES